MSWNFIAFIIGSVLISFQNVVITSNYRDKLFIIRGLLSTEGVFDVQISTENTLFTDFALVKYLIPLNLIFLWKTRKIKILGIFMILTIWARFILPLKLFKLGST